MKMLILYISFIYALLFHSFFVRYFVNLKICATYIILPDIQYLLHHNFDDNRNLVRAV